MNWETINRYLTLIVASVAVGLSVNVAYKTFTRPSIDTAIFEQYFRQVPIDKVEVKLDEKKARLLNLPSISLHYADEERIKNFYNDYFREPTTESLVREAISESSGESSAKLPEILESKIGTKSLSKWIQTVKLPETSVNGMFRRYQRETIKNDQVSLNLDVVNIELSTLNEFDELVERIYSEYKLKINSEKLATKRLELKSKSAETVVKLLENASGTTIIEGKFLIIDYSEKYYRCRFIHPVNEYLAANKELISISFLLPKSNIADFVAGNYAQSIGKAIPLKVYGEVWQPINRSTGEYDLQITPLAVY